MGRVIAVLLLSLSLTAFAQTNSQPSSSQQTSTIPARVNLDPAQPVYSATTPIGIVPPPPAPGETPVVYQEYRVATPLVPSGPPSEAVNADTTPANADINTTAPRTGVVAYAVSTPPSGPSITVADAASQYKSNKSAMKSRVLDNNSLASLDKNPSGLVTATELTMPQGDRDSDVELAPANARPEHAAAGDVLDPRDLAAVEAAVARGQNQQGTASSADQNSTATQDSNAPSAGNSATPSQPDVQTNAPQQPSTDEAAPQASDETDRPRSQSRDQLPESSSALPLLGLMGFLAASGGALSVWRSRG